MPEKPRKYSFFCLLSFYFCLDVLASAEPTIHYGDDLLGISLNSAQITEFKFTLQKTHPIYYSFDECLLNNQLNNSTIHVRSF
jgi:hypothetical protein